MVDFEAFTVRQIWFRVDDMQNITGSTTTALQHKVIQTMTKRTFCTVATTSPAGFAHSAGVVYAFADNALWIHTLRTSRKARNVEANGRVGICIPFRRLPVGPPYTIHFQASADVLSMDDPAAVSLVASGALKGITGHGELDMADGCFVRIRPGGTIHSFGPGAKIIDLIRNPLTSGAGSFDYAEAS